MDGTLAFGNDLIVSGGKGDLEDCCKGIHGFVVFDVRDHMKWIKCWTSCVASIATAVQHSSSFVTFLKVQRDQNVHR